jgi:putative toxin-antitoxin system antitoxin component (TIGR02293 family)
VVEELMRASGLSLKELAESLDLSPRSLQRRRRSGRLARFESDRLYRLARIVALARQSLGNQELAMRWLQRTNRALGGLAPVAAIDTEPGARAADLAHYGDEFAQRAACALLLVPSALAPSENNWLINPQHPDFRKIIPRETQPLNYDPRLLHREHPHRERLHRETRGRKRK